MDAPCFAITPLGSTLSLTPILFLLFRGSLPYPPTLSPRYFIISNSSNFFLFISTISQFSYYTPSHLIISTVPIFTSKYVFPLRYTLSPIISFLSSSTAMAVFFLFCTYLWLDRWGRSTFGLFTVASCFPIVWLQLRFSECCCARWPAALIYVIKRATKQRLVTLVHPTCSLDSSCNHSLFGGNATPIEA